MVTGLTALVILEVRTGKYRIQWSLITMYVLYKSTSTFIWVMGVVTRVVICVARVVDDILETRQ